MKRPPSEPDEGVATESLHKAPATAAEVMKQLDDHIGAIYEHYLSTRNCPPDFHGLHEHLYFHHEVSFFRSSLMIEKKSIKSFLIITLMILCR